MKKSKLALLLISLFLGACNTTEDIENPLVENPLVEAPPANGEEVAEPDENNETVEVQLQLVSRMLTANNRVALMDLATGEEVMFHDFLEVETTAGQWELENGYVAVWVEWRDLASMAEFGHDISEFVDMEPNLSRFVILDNHLNYMETINFSEDAPLHQGDRFLRVSQQESSLSWRNGEVFIYGQTRSSNPNSVGGEVVRHNLHTGETEVITYLDLNLSLHGFLDETTVAVFSSNGVMPSPEMRHGTLDLTTGELQLLDRMEVAVNNYTVDGNRLLIRELEVSSVDGMGSAFTGDVTIVDFQTLEVVTVSLQDEDSVRAQLIAESDTIATVSSEGDRLRLYNFQGEMLAEASLTLNLPEVGAGGLFAAQFLSIFPADDEVFMIIWVDNEWEHHIQFVSLED